MAKSKRKPSAAQRDKFAISLASILKKKGVISKHAKLHGGKYVSRNVLKKVQEFQHLADDRYKVVKVPKAYARKAKDLEYQTVFGNKVVVPNEPEFIKRVKRGDITGVKPLKGGFMSELNIPLDASNIGDLTMSDDLDALEELRAPGEQFAFSFEGAMSFRAFRSIEDMRKYLEHYKQDTAITALKIYRLRPEDVSTFIPSKDERERLRKSRPRTHQERRTKSRKLENLHPLIADKVRKRQKARNDAQREKLMRDPAKLEAYRAKARERARISYQNRKPEK